MSSSMLPLTGPTEASWTTDDDASFLVLLGDQQQTIKRPLIDHRPQLLQSVSWGRCASVVGRTFSKFCRNCVTSFLWRAVISSVKQPPGDQTRQRSLPHKQNLVMDFSLDTRMYSRVCLLYTRLYTWLYTWLYTQRLETEVVDLWTQSTLTGALK